MKVFCNGFNLYGQLDRPELLLENFTDVFGNQCLKDICIQHSFSVLLTNSACFIYGSHKEKSLNNLGDIIKISSNNERVLILNNVGKMFKTELSNFDLIYDIPNICNSEDPDEKIVNCICGSKLTVAYSNNGVLYNIPYKLNFKNLDITDIKCGREHCILLDSFGNVYTFGRGSRGQLGHGHLDDESEPLLVEALAGIKIVQIAAGGWHSCAVSKDGDLYTWGWNGNGQLGLGPKNEEAKCEENQNVSVMASPHVVDLCDPLRNVVKVACGSRHTIILLDNFYLLGSGWNKYKQLANEPKEDFYTFTYLHDFSAEDVIELKCGPWNSIVLCKDILNG